MQHQKKKKKSPTQSHKLQSPSLEKNKITHFAFNLLVVITTIPNAMFNRWLGKLSLC